MIDQLRELGLSMASHYAPVTAEVEDEETGERVLVTAQRFIAWTTDEAKATAAQELGAQIRTYRSNDPRFSGWEVNASVVVE